MSCLPLQTIQRLALVREGAGFHSSQIYEAGLRQYRRFGGQPIGGHIMTGVTRFLAAHSHAVRAAGQTYETAIRLGKSESLLGDEE